MKKKRGNYAFIDSQNVNLSVKDAHWNLDFKRLYIYLKHKFQVEKVYVFIGYVSGNNKLYDYLQKVGYILIFKPTLKNQAGHIKGNCDAELVLHCMIEYENFEKAIIISGDGDFYCLIDYLKDRKKLLGIGIPNKKRYSALLRKFIPYFFYISDLRNKLEYKKREVL